MSRTGGLLFSYFAAVAALAAALLWAETARWGVGVSPDSVGYIEDARRLATPGGASALAHGFVSQPPGYPLLLAGVARATGADPGDAARAVNAALLALGLFAACVLLARGLNARLHPLIAVTLPLFILTSRSLHAVFVMAWSEPLFIAFSMLFLAGLCGHLRRGEPGPLALAVAVTLAALWTRYSGVSFIAAGVIALLAVPVPARRRLASAALFGALTTAAFGAWIARNLSVAGSAFGERPAAVFSLQENVLLALRVLQSHFLPASEQLPVAAKIAIAAAVAGLLAIALIPRAKPLAAALAGERALLVPCAALGLVFTLFTIGTSSVVAYDPINLRLLAPAFLPLFLAVAVVANAALQLGNGDRGRFAPAAIALLVGLALVQPIRQFAGDCARQRREGAGLSGAAWAESELLAALGDWPGGAPAGALFSNVPSALKWRHGLDALNAPSRAACSGLAGVSARACFDEEVDPRFRGAHFVYFSTQDYPYYYGLDELRAFVALTPVAIAADGGVYRVGPLATPAPPQPPVPIP